MWVRVPIVNSSTDNNFGKVVEPVDKVCLVPDLPTALCFDGSKWCVVAA